MGLLVLQERSSERRSGPRNQAEPQRLRARDIRMKARCREQEGTGPCRLARGPAHGSPRQLLPIRQAGRRQGLALLLGLVPHTRAAEGRDVSQREGRSRSEKRDPTSDSAELWASHAPHKQHHLDLLSDSSGGPSPHTCRRSGSSPSTARSLSTFRSNPQHHRL